MAFSNLIHNYLRVFWQCSSVSLDGTLVREAEGLLADMMADPDVPRHLVGGLRAVSQILKSTDGSSHRTKTSPAVSLSDGSLCANDYADLPYVDRPLYLPKVSLCYYYNIESAVTGVSFNQRHLL